MSPKIPRWCSHLQIVAFRADRDSFETGMYRRGSCSQLKRQAQLRQRPVFTVHSTRQAAPPNQPESDPDAAGIHQAGVNWHPMG
jgi:hypothetical protein